MRQRTKVNNSWAGETVVLIASGASLTQDDVDYCQGRGARVVVVNDNYRLAPWADLLYACDFHWWEHHQDALNFAGEKWTQDKRAAAEYGVNKIDGEHGIELSTRPGFIRFGQNSGFQALNLALLRDPARFILLGYDMGGKHWFGDHPAGMPNPTEQIFLKWIKAFNGVPEQLAAMGKTIVNCSRDTAITEIERQPLRAVL